MLVEVAIGHKFVDNEELSVLSVQAPKQKVAYLAGPAFYVHQVLVARFADGAQLREEVLKLFLRVLGDFLHSHIPTSHFTFGYPAGATRSGLVPVGEFALRDGQVVVLQSVKPTLLSKGVAFLFQFQP